MVVLSILLVFYAIPILGILIAIWCHNGHFSEETLKEIDLESKFGLQEFSKAVFVIFTPILNWFTLFFTVKLFIKG